MPIWLFAVALAVAALSNGLTFFVSRLLISSVEREREDRHKVESEHRMEMRAMWVRVSGMPVPVVAPSDREIKPEPSGRWVMDPEGFEAVFLEDE